MIFFIDRLCRPACRKVAALKRRMGVTGAVDIRVLDPLPPGGRTGLRVSRLGRGGEVKEVPFIAGRLKMPDGQPVYIASRRHAHAIAFQAARSLMDRSPLIARLNAEWGRNTILLNLARFLWAPVNELLVRLLVTDALLRDSGDEGVPLICRLPTYINPDLFQPFSSRLTLACYPPDPGRRAMEQASAPLWILRQKLRQGKWAFGRKRGSGFLERFPADEKPSVLLLQEDEIRPDRSYRTQPHWLDPADAPARFRTLILKTEDDSGSNRSGNEIADANVLPLSLPDWCGSAGGKGAHPVEKRLGRDLRICIRALPAGSEGERAALFPLIRLLSTARDLAAFCRQTRVKAFMTCENYMIGADAMQLIASPMRIRTFSYQYSNMGRVGPHMLTTADAMAMFSPLYHDRWKRDGIGPGRFIDTGYVFEGAFKHLKERAGDHRRRMQAAGARFILCYFDENAFEGKYELVTHADLREEITALLNLVLTDSHIGLIMKSQFQRHSPRQLGQVASLRAAAEATGRYVELSHGSVRNIVFPAEAAMAADMVLGHAVGATAPLEAALAGTRAILLNPYGIKNENDAIYARADILYPSLETALEAIGDYRAGKPEKAGLGDWSSILAHFDSFRDGQAGQRLKKLLNEALSGDH
jgi:hypothetical protein